MGLRDSSQPIMFVIVVVTIAVQWLEAHGKEKNRQEAPTRGQLQRLDCLRELDLFEIICKILNIPMKNKKHMGQKTTVAMV